MCILFIKILDKIGISFTSVGACLLHEKIPIAGSNPAGSKYFYFEFFDGCLDTKIYFSE